MQRLVVFKYNLPKIRAIVEAPKHKITYKGRTFYTNKAKPGPIGLFIHKLFGATWDVVDDAELLDLIYNEGENNERPTTRTSTRS